MQKLHWDPLFAWIKDEFGVVLRVAEGFSPARQSSETAETLRKVVEEMDIWELAGLSSSTSGALWLSPRTSV
jgi:ATP synthase F1 complex assembly factor 2